MPRPKRVLTVNIRELIRALIDNPVKSSNYTTVIHRGTIEKPGDGRNYEIHIKITTDEDDFINDKP